MLMNSVRFAKIRLIISSVIYLLEWQKIIKSRQILTVIYLVANEYSGPHIFRFCHAVRNYSATQYTCT